MTLHTANRVLATALEARAFSAVTAEVGGLSGRYWTHAAGRLGFGPEHQPVTSDTIFDLASLTKVLATTSIALRLVASDQVRLDTAIKNLVRGWEGDDRADVTIRDLLEHSSGLPAWRPYFLTHTGRAAYETAISAESLEYTPRSRSIYSDLGFMLLGFILDDIGAGSLPDQFRAWRSGAAVREPIDFHPPAEWRSRIALTEQDPWRGRVLCGEVQDENAAALGGAAGHAGLFGTAAAVGACARWWLARLSGSDDEATGVSASLAQSFTVRSHVRGSSRAVGWDTMVPTSSCGTRLSARAVGHTGFTGTSLWIDPSNDLYIDLLTNRVHPTRDNEAIQQVRRDFHDAVISDLENERA